MTDEMLLLAKRAVACKGWWWMPGMRWWTDDDRGRLDDYQPEYMGRPTDALPDLSDPATVGCLLALVRVAYADPYASVWYSSDHNHSGDRWSYYSKAFSFTGHATEAEALVVALESAL
jgi:hypothetical protein